MTLDPTSRRPLSRTIAVIVAAAAVALAAGCTPSRKEQPLAPPGSQASGTVEFWHFFTDREADAIAGVVKDFEAKYPKIKVTVKLGQDDEQMRKAIAAGEGPDLGLSYSTDIVGQFCATGAWRDLKPFVDRDKVDLGKLNATVRSYTEHNGKRCSLPMLADAYGLYYNKNLMGGKQPPKTIAELTQLAKDLTKRNPDGSIQVAGFVPWVGFYEMRPSRWGPIYDARWLTDGGTSAIGSQPGWQEFLRWQKELVDWYGVDHLQRFIAGLGQEYSADNAFHQGKVAMMVDGEYRVAFLRAQAKDIAFGTAPLPVPAAASDRYGAGYVTGNIIGISRGARNPEAAWALLSYLSLDTGALVKLSNSLKNVPTTKDALASPDLEKDPEFKTFLDIFTHPRSATTPPTHNGNAYLIAFEDLIQKWQSGQVSDLPAALKELDKQIDAALKLGS